MKTLAGVVASGAEAHISDKAGRALGFAPNRCGGRLSGAEAAQIHRVSLGRSSAARAMETTKGSAQSNETAEANFVSQLSCRLGMSVSSTALASRLASDEAPNADFSAFLPFGKRAMKLMTFLAQIIVGGELTTKTVPVAPRFCSVANKRRVFCTTMLKLDASPPGPLDTHEEGIRQLHSTGAISPW